MLFIISVGGAIRDKKLGRKQLFFFYLLIALFYRTDLCTEPVELTRTSATVKYSVTSKICIRWCEYLNRTPINQQAKCLLCTFIVFDLFLSLKYIASFLCKQKMKSKQHLLPSLLKAVSKGTNIGNQWFIKSYRNKYVELQYSLVFISDCCTSVLLLEIELPKFSYTTKYSTFAVTLPMSSRPFL